MTKRPHKEAQADAKEPIANEKNTDYEQREDTVNNVLPEASDISSEKMGGKPEKLSPDSEIDKELSELNERYVRLAAEYDNYRKRTQRERDALYSDAVAEITKEWLPVVDNIERAMCFSDEQSPETVQKVAEGVRLIHRQIQEVFAKFGIEEIECPIGECFDPNIHEAVLHTEDSEFGDHCVVQVFQKGYRTSDRIIRHSVVKVAN